MAEHIQPEKLVIPSWRVMLMLGTMGTSGEIDDFRISALPDLALLSDLVSPGESMQVLPAKGTCAYLADWRLRRIDDTEALEYGITNTTALAESVGLAGVEIKSARVAELTSEIQDEDPNTVWDTIEEIVDYKALLAIRTLTIDDFLL